MVEEYVINDYYKDNAKKLRDIIDGLLTNFGGICGKDKEDFYSIGNEVFLNAINLYNPEKSSFKTYLTNCLKNRIKSEMTRRNAKRRCANVLSINDDDNVLNICDETDFEEELLSDEVVSDYMSRFTNLGKKIIAMRMNNISDTDIQKKLGITKRKIEDEMKKAMNVVGLSKINSKNVKEIKNNTIEERKETRIMNISPDYRDDYLSIDLIKTMIDAGELLINHPNQRNDWMWNNEDVSALIATNLHGFRINPIIVCEENIGNGAVLNWVVDGKQRITAMIHFAYDGDNRNFRISKNTEYAEIPYQTPLKDEDGNIIRDEFGRPILETKVFDIRGKKFSDFPAELQRRFKSYVFTLTRYVNCDKDMITYHIRRYNKGKAMNPVQKANTYWNDENASRCKKVADNIFFANLPDFSDKKLRNGASERVVIDSIMAMNYRDNWNSKLERSYSFFNENGDASDFELLDDYLTRLNNIVDEDTIKLFTAKNAYMFIALFHYFDCFGLADEEYNNFLRGFINEYHSVKVGEYCFDDDIDNARSRDVKWVKTKMDILERLVDNAVLGSAA